MQTADMENVYVMIFKPEGVQKIFEIWMFLIEIWLLLHVHAFLFLDCEIMVLLDVCLYKNKLHSTYLRIHILNDIIFMVNLRHHQKAL